MSYRGGEEREWISQGTQKDGTLFRIARDQWERHVSKRPEIADALALTNRARWEASNSEPDSGRPDEPRRKFRLLSIPGSGRWQGYVLRVSVKYVKQPDGEWIKFYQSCWYERRR
ncbi:MAG: hypothetical protein DRP95_01710 [Candidatus Latescibacterota bacterium]|nr:MAG: hypothetical protein DRP95_01710 [Candidatus Latescibacterota bacterium]